MYDNRDYVVRNPAGRRTACGRLVLWTRTRQDLGVKGLSITSVGKRKASEYRLFDGERRWDCEDIIRAHAVEPPPTVFLYKRAFRHGILDTCSSVA